MKKLITICAAAVFVLAVTGPAQAQEPDVWVNDDWTWDEIWSLWQEYDGALMFSEFLAQCIFETIQEGVDGVAPGGTVYVFDGTYTENVVINKDGVTVEAHSSPIIDGGGSLGPGVHITADDVTFQGFIIRNFTCTPSSGIGGVWVEGHRARINLNTIYDIVTTGDPLLDPAGIGIDVKGVDDVNVSNNTVYDVGSIGIRIRGDYYNSSVQVTGTLVVGNTVYNTRNSSMLVAGNVNGITIENNTIHDSLAPTPYGLLMIGDPVGLGGVVDTAQIEGNTIYNTYGNVTLGSVTNITVTGNTISNAIPHYTDPDNIKGKNIYIRNWSDVLTTNVTITNNHIIDADGYGVMIRYNGSGDPSTMVSTTTVNCNNISGNTIGIENPIAKALDATYNWWGDPSGPSGESPGSGDPISENVDFFPWLLDDNIEDCNNPILCDYQGCETVVVNDDWASLPDGTCVYEFGYGGFEIGYNAFDTIQEGIDNVCDSTVLVLPGTYNEQVFISEPNLTVQSTDGAAATIIDGAGVPDGGQTGHNALVWLQKDGITFKGFSVQNYDFDNNGGLVVIHGWDGTNWAEGISGCLVTENKVIGAVVTPAVDNIQMGYGASNNIIRCNEILDSDGDGIIVCSDPDCVDNQITCNTITNSANYGVSLCTATWGTQRNFPGTVISHNEISGGTHGIGVIYAAGSEASPIVINNNYIYGVADGEAEGIEVYYGDNVDMFRNDVARNGTGIQVKFSGGIAANYNNITGNDANGVEAVNVIDTVDATNNWWGDPSGPSGEGPGSGDAVSVNVDFDPWWVCGSTVHPCPIGDLDHDSTVNFFDFAIFADHWLEGATPQCD